jgi:hypothetical protein|tara:strand:+ start:430 stop:690 length:261 start_codon:yes stop_codon:yes gene_type:complete
MRYDPIVPPFTFYYPFRWAGELPKREKRMSDDFPNLRVLSSEGAPPQERVVDCLFEIGRTFASLHDQFERLFVAYSDAVHGTPVDE